MNSESETRTYRQTARAKAAEETGARIVEAFMARMEDCWFEEIRLDDVASDAGVTVQTVIRRFGGKDGLLEASLQKMDAEILRERQLPVGDVPRIVDLIVSEYELRGGLVNHFLAQEDRHPAIRRLTDHGRDVHREWVGSVFAPWLEGLDGSRHCELHDRLVLALDIYVWKLLRIDMRRSKDFVRQTMLELCAGALGVSANEFGTPTSSEKIDGSY